MIKGNNKSRNENGTKVTVADNPTHGYLIFTLRNSFIFAALDQTYEISTISMIPLSIAFM